MSIVFECQGLTKKYGHLLALNAIDLKLESGKIIGLLGPNGSGKTTLLKLGAGLLVPTEGEVLINGLKPSIETKAVTAFLPERNSLDVNMTVDYILKFFADFYFDFNIEKARRLLNDLGVNSKNKLSQLSKGNREKVQLILTMSREAKLYLLDEPIGGVDPASRDYILKTIINSYNKDACVLISTHLIADVEDILDDYVFIREGKIIKKGNVASIKSRNKKSLDQIFREAFTC
ncbi:MAG: ABC transporter ATP-binding protein [Clostridia bacterium]|nr:ABC transporter ATP-binding protein [Clostridia bacterium]